MLKVTNKAFIAAFRELQSPTKVAKATGLTERSVHRRRRELEKEGVQFQVLDSRSERYTLPAQKAIAHLKIDTGVILIGSDAHLWPQELSTAQRAFIRFAKELKPAAIIANGDMLDGATISRWPSIGWENKPSVMQEIEAVGSFLDQVLKSSPNSKRFWPAGNHDLRLESRLAQVAPEYAGIKGIHLNDHIPGWQSCWRVDINFDSDFPVIVRHREKGGVHADYRNVVESGVTLVTGHDHQLTVEPYIDYREKLRWGVRTGYLAASPYEPQFIHYLEARRPRWISGFVVLRFEKGRLLWPQPVVVVADGLVDYAGQLISV